MSKLLQSYLRFWAVKYLNRTHPKIVAVTGSVGKTSTKEAIFEVLCVKFGEKVRKSEGNLNNQTGLPLAILNYKSAPSYGQNAWKWFSILFSVPFRSFTLKPVEILVLEYAADKPGDIKYLTNVARPDVAILTAIGPAHLTAFGTIEKIVEEKTNLLRALSIDGWAILNLDNELVRKSSYGGRWQKKTYAIGQEADVQAVDIKNQIKNFEPTTTFQVKYNGQKIQGSQKTLGNAFVLASLAAIAVGEIFKLNNQEIVKGIANIKLQKHRMNVFEGKEKTVILDDSYNANPVSMQAALDVLKSLPHAPAGARKIAVLGEMREIGKISVEAHKNIGQSAKEIADLTIGIGQLAKNYQAFGQSLGHYLQADIMGCVKELKK